MRITPWASAQRRGGGSDALRRAIALAAIAALACGAAACGSSNDRTATAGGDSSRTSGDPIKVGAIVTVKGALDYSAAPAGAEAYFKALNERGGINGRPVEIETVNDESDPSRAAAAARKMLGGGVVAMVGSDSTVDCAANDQLYRAKQAINLVALASNPTCLASPNQVTVVHTAAALNAAALLVDKLHKKRVVYITFDAPAGRSSAQVVERFLKQRGALGGASEFVQPGKDPSASISRVKRRNPDGIVILALYPIATAIIKGLDQQGLTPSNGVDIASVLGLYEQQTPEVLGKSGEGVYVVLDFEPLQAKDPDPEVLRWRAAMQKHVPDKPLSALAQAGWVAADIFTQAAKTIHGEITPAKVTAAVKSIRKFESGMLPCPAMIGDQQAYPMIHRCHNVVQIKNGAWTQRDDLGVLMLPPKGFSLAP
jgi:branched-chain amino acid transport system substrate-binding protein